MSRTYRKHSKEFKAPKQSFNPKPRRKQEPLKELRLPEEELLPVFHPMQQLELML